MKESTPGCDQPSILITPVLLSMGDVLVARCCEGRWETASDITG